MPENHPPRVYWDDSMLKVLEENDIQLIQAAEAVIEQNFDDQKYNHTVGAAIRAGSGKIYVGINVDGIHGSCAEYIAIGAALSAGERVFSNVVAVYGKDSPHNVLPPCGNCRQMLFDYTPDCLVILKIEDEYRKIKISDLLPYPCI
jgi:cytidine deaminase